MGNNLSQAISINLSITVYSCLSVSVVMSGYFSVHIYDGIHDISIPKKKKLLLHSNQVVYSKEISLVCGTVLSSYIYISVNLVWVFV